MWFLSIKLIQFKLLIGNLWNLDASALVYLVEPFLIWAKIH
jgi:hypothetical protein